MSAIGTLKPANKLRPEEMRQAMWDAIRSTKGQVFTTSVVARKTWAGYDAIRNFLEALTNAGYLERTAPAYIGGAAVYCLARDTGVEAPRVRRDGTESTRGRGREQMWRTMRILSDFTAQDIAITASTEERHIALSEAKTYLYRLHQAGYLRVVMKGKPGNKRGTGNLARYLFFRHMYTGPRAPQVQSDRQVYDPNLKRVVTGGAHDIQ
jgi:hypothetical protein